MGWVLSIGGWNLDLESTIKSCEMGWNQFLLTAGEPLEIWQLCYKRLHADLIKYLQFKLHTKKQIMPNRDVHR